LDLSAPAPQPAPAAEAQVERSERRPVTLRGHAVRSDLSMIEVSVVDLSYDGCGIETETALTPGEAIRIGVLKRGVIDAHVRWVLNGKAGVAFSPEAEEVEEQRHRERQSERVALEADVMIRRLGKLSYRVRVFDASPHGCRVEFIERPAIGELVRIKFDGLQPIDARTCWIEDHCAGVEFDRPIHPAVFDLLVARSQARAEGA
jgi:hypothetical protein